jgi:hypothetical protein
MSSEQPVQEHPDTRRLREYMKKLEGADDLDLINHMAGWKETEPKYRAISIELQRRAKKREQRVAWVAIGISAVSLLISIVSAATRGM